MTVSALIVILLASGNIDSLLADTGGNESMWFEYLSSASGDTLECCKFLLENIPRLDRLEMTRESLDDVILCSLPFRGGMPDSIFLYGLLWNRTDTEPVAPCRASLGEFWKGQDVSEPVQVIRWTSENMAIHPAQFLGEMQSPLAVLEASGGTEAEIMVFHAASFRSLGYPVRTVTGWFGGSEGGERNWLEIWADGSWVSLEEDLSGLVLAVEESRGEYLTDTYTRTGTLITVPPDPAGGEFMLTLNLPVTGRYLPLDWAMPLSDEPDTVSLGPAELLVILSRRLPTGAVEVWNSLVTVLPGDTFFWSAPVLSEDPCGVIMPPQEH